MRAIALALTLALAAASAAAQTYRFKVYDANVGLPSNGVYSVFQDRRGYMWFATDGGAVRYDGVRFSVFDGAHGLADTSVRAVTEDADGRLWVATKGGVARWNGRRFEAFTTAQGLVHDEVRCALSRRDGSLWFGTTRGLSRFQGGAFRNYGADQGLPPVPVWSLLEDRAGVLWVGMRGGGLARLHGERFVVYSAEHGLPDDNVFAMAEDRLGGLWVATDGGLVHFDGRQFRRYGTADGLGSELVSSVLVDAYGRVWAGTFGGGVSRLEGGRFTVFDRRRGLPDDYITSVYHDREGNLWFASLWSGAFRLGSEQFTNYTRASGLPEGMITGLAETPDGALWVASINSGLVRMDARGRLTVYRARDGLLEERLWAILADRRGRIWVGGSSGVSLWDGRRFRRFRLEEMGARDRINAIAEDAQGRIWFASGAARSNGVVVYDGTGFTRYSTEHGLAHNQVNTVAVDRAGNVWICTEDGLSRFDGRAFQTWRAGHGLPKRVVAAYEDEQGRLWAGTAEGLALFDGSAFRVWRTEHGLVNNFVHSLTSRDGRLWIGTGGGLSTFDGSQFLSYTTRDGLVSNQISVAAPLRRADGSIWFATADGLIRWAPARETRTPVPPLVHLTAVRAGERELPAQGALSLPHRDGTLTFEFVGLSFTDEQAVRYSYRLEGLDAGWSPPAESRSVRYIHLSPGSYRFLVKARSSSGSWSEPASLAFEVGSPLWATWWFRLGAATLLLGAAGALYASRVRSLTRRHRERMESLRELLDSIRIINSGLALHTVLQNIAAESARLIQAEPAGIGLVRGDRVVFQRIWREGDWHDGEVSFARGEGVAGRVAVSGRPAVVNEDRPDARLPEALGAAPAGFMVLPVVDRKGEVVGILAVRRPEGRAPFGDHERQLLESLAHQAAVAIENAALYGDLEEKKSRLAESLSATEELFHHEQQVSRMLQELNDMKTSFMIVTAHEMRTPLTILKGYQEALRGGLLGRLSAEQAHSVAVCERTTDRLIASFNDILQMLEIDGGRLQVHARPTDVAAVAREALARMEPFLEQRALEVEVDCPPCPLRLDTDKIQVVLDNLLENAIKFTPDGGRIAVRVAEEAGAVHLRVEDSGIGIDADERERIFDKFYTSRDPRHHSSGTYQFRARGPGLGLAIARGYVEAHGGRIWAESPGAGQGSVFHVVLPRAAGAALPRAASA